jgi:LysR family hydrogen peroxide-inducible transcriptional activator
MNFHQLRYLVALADKGNYSEAALACNISQPALSMAIKKLESDFGQLLFNRQTQPIRLTDFGEKIYVQTQKILFEVDQLRAISNTSSNKIEGTLKVGIIPTLAPYLLPLFLETFIKTYPYIHLDIEENTTDQLLEKLRKGKLDVALLVTPLDIQSIDFVPLFYEEFFVYSHDATEKNFILPEEIDLNELWLLEEGHCLRNQILNLCELKKSKLPKISYQAGSIETLKNLVDEFSGMTIIPELATLKMNARSRKKLISFHPPAPVREVSLSHHQYTVYKPHILALQESILLSIPGYLKNPDTFTKIEIGELKRKA